jgi:riboflavin kinase/FMN adenylyltransferase
MKGEQVSSSPAIRAIEALDRSFRIVTIGTFDGVHRGHQSLIASAVARAGQRSMRSLVVTFEPIPASVLRPEQFAGRICSADEKIGCLAAFPLDEIVTLTFDHALAEQTPEAFMGMLVEKTGLVELWVGEAFALGKNRTGDVDRLREIGRSLGYELTAVPRLTDDGMVISSSAIRKAIGEGQVERAHRFLGRPFSVHGEVVHGAHLGRTIGYPTANVVPPPELVGLADGIYVSLSSIPGWPASRPSMTYVGTRPTVNSGARLIETHLLDFDGDLYGRTLRVELLAHLRGDAVFAGVEPLIAQLREDEAATRRYLEGSGSDFR